MASRQHYINLAKSLPPTLQRFLTRYPASTIFEAASSSSNSPNGTALQPQPAQQQQQEQEQTPPNPQPTGYQSDRGGASPFDFWRHPATGKWQDPVYSLRRQADLIKLAREHGVEELLPASLKGIDSKIAKRVEHGLRVKGTGVGQRVKGHKYERMMTMKMAKRRKAMLKMPSLIAKWRKRGANRWRHFPRRISPMS